MNVKIPVDDTVAQMAIARVTFDPDSVMIICNFEETVVVPAATQIAKNKALQRAFWEQHGGRRSRVGTTSTKLFDRSELQEELHTLGNALAQIKIGNRLIAREELDPAKRREFIEEIDRSIADAESVFRLLSAQLK